MDNFKKNVLNTIKQNNLIKKGDRIVLGVSGGPDSICLLNILNEIRLDLNKENCTQIKSVNQTRNH